MAVLLAVLSSMTIGAADFMGGLISRRAAAISVVVTSHLSGLLVAVVAAPIWGWEGALRADLLWGAAAGTAGAGGLVVIYHAMATTRFTVAAAAAALLGSLVPVAYGVAIGERPAPLAWIGVALALPAVLLITVNTDDEIGKARTVRRAAVLGGAAGLLFALFGILISRTGGTSGIVPLVGARLASIPMMAALALGARRPVLAANGVMPTALLVGALDMIANILFLAALRRGFVSLVILISSMYPAFTVVLARLFLEERLNRVQSIGLVMAAVGVGMIAVA